MKIFDASGNIPEQNLNKAKVISKFVFLGGMGLGSVLFLFGKKALLASFVVFTIGGFGIMANMILEDMIQEQRAKKFQEKQRSSSTRTKGGKK